MTMTVWYWPFVGRVLRPQTLSTFYFFKDPSPGFPVHVPMLLALELGSALVTQNFENNKALTRVQLLTW